MGKGCVDHMSVEGGPGAGSDPKKIAGIVCAILCALLTLGTLAIVMTLDHTMSCHEEDVKFFVDKVDFPVISSIEPQYVCVAEQSRTITLTGTNFIQYNEANPVVQVGRNGSTLPVELQGTPTELDVFRNDAQAYTTAVVTLPKSSAVDNVAQPEVTLLQPVPVVSSSHFTADVPKYDAEGCTATAPAASLLMVPPPLIENVYPRVVCSASTQAVLVDGKFIALFANGGAGDDAAPAATTTSAAARKRQVTTTSAAATTSTTVGGSSTTTSGATTASGTLAPTSSTTSGTATSTSASSTTGAAISTSSTTANGVTSTSSSTTTTTTTNSTPAPTSAGENVSTQGPDQVTASGGAALVSIGDGKLNITDDALLGTSCSAASSGSSLQLCEQIAFDVEVDTLGASPEDGKSESLELLLENPAPIGCASSSAKLHVINPVSIDRVEPPVFFIDQAPARGTLFGANFLSIDGRVPSIEFRVVGGADGGTVLARAENVQVRSCGTGIDGFQVCSQLTFTVPKGPTRTTSLELHVLQPAPLDSACGDSIESALLNAPRVDSPATPLLCAGQALNLTGLFYKIGAKDRAFQYTQLTLNGTEFKMNEEVDVNAGLLGDSNETFTDNALIVTTYLDVSFSIETLKTLLPAAGVDASEPFSPSAELSQPYFDELPGVSPYDALVTVVPLVRVDTPPFAGVCNADDVLTFEGDWIVRVGDELPTVTLGGAVQSMVETRNCTPFDSVVPGSQRCTSLRVTVESLDSVGALSFANPSSLAQCSSYELSTPVAKLSEPTVTQPSAPLDLCVGGVNQTLRIDGSFPVNDGMLPQFALNGVVFADTSCATAAESPCTELIVSIDPAIANANLDKIGVGDLNGIVRVNEQCVSAQVPVKGRSVGRITKVTPDRICAAAPGVLQVEGERIENSGALFTVPGSSVARALIGTTCTDTCTVGSVNLTSADATELVRFVADEERFVDVGVQSGVCGSSTAELLTVVPQPVLSAISTTQLTVSGHPGDHRMCSDHAVRLQIDGNGFSETPGSLTVKFVKRDDANSTYDVQAEFVTVNSNVRVTVTLPESDVPPGEYEVQVQNMAGCVGSSLDIADASGRYLAVHPPVIVQDVVPRLLSLDAFATSGAGSSVTLNVQGVLTTNSNFYTFVTDTADQSASFTSAAPVSNVPTAFTTDTSLLNALSTPGNYYARFRTEIGCIGESSAPIFQVVAAATALPVDNIAPRAGSVNTEIVIQAPASQTWSPGTLVYLRYSDKVEPLVDSYVIDDGAAVRGVFRALAPSDFETTDVLVVDSANGVVAKAASGFQTVIASFTFRIVSLTPSTLVAGTSNVVEARVNAGISTDTCEVVCTDRDGTNRATADCSVSARTDGTEQVPMTIGDAGLTAGQLCQVRVVRSNAGNATQQVLVSSDVAVVSDQLPTVLQLPNALLAPRSEACGIAVDVAPRPGALNADFVHVLGGVDASDQPLKTTEMSPARSAAPQFVATRELAADAEQPGCSLVGAPGSRYVYVVSAESGTAQRARVLHPFYTPTAYASLHFETDAPATPFAVGAYRYRVSATSLAGSWPSADNVPSATLLESDGESLPSNIVSVTVPVNATAARIRVVWSLPAGITSTGFRVFRATGATGAFELIGTVANDVTFFDDDNSATPDAQQTPLPAGALGAWQSDTLSGVPSQPTTTFVTSTGVLRATAGNQVWTVGTDLQKSAQTALGFAGGVSRLLTVPSVPNTAALVYSGGYAVLSGATVGNLVSTDSYYVSGCVGVQDSASKQAVFVGQAVTRETLVTAPLSTSGSLTIGAKTPASSQPESQESAACAQASGQLWLAGGDYMGATSRMVQVVVL